MTEFAATWPHFWDTFSRLLLKTKPKKSNPMQGVSDSSCGEKHCFKIMAAEIMGFKVETKKAN
jgi:hypothetical protein